VRLSLTDLSASLTDVVQNDTGVSSLKINARKNNENSCDVVSLDF